jgi:hypothetical protein
MAVCLIGGGGIERLEGDLGEYSVAARVFSLRLPSFPWSFSCFPYCWLVTFVVFSFEA